MNEEQIMAEFYEMVDEFVHLANELNEKHNSTKISSAMMFAAARYSAFNFFVTDGERENEAKAIDYYSEQFRKMLHDNFQETRNSYSRSNETK